MTAPLDFSTVTNALPAIAFGLASRIGYEGHPVGHRRVWIETSAKRAT